MADIAVASQLQQWTFEKPSLDTRPDRSGSDSSASSPILCDDTPETLRVDSASPEHASPAPRKESIVLQERYMSSEEALSPVDDGSDSDYDCDNVVVHDATKECKARPSWFRMLLLAVPRWSSWIVAHLPPKFDQFSNAQPRSPTCQSQPLASCEKQTPPNVCQ
jgi:hypothetical protein